MRRLIAVIIVLTILLSGVPAIAEGVHTIYMPIVYGEPTRLGAFWWGNLDSQYVQKFQWIRYPVFWNEIELSPNVYSWKYSTDIAMEYFNENNNPVMINIHRSPDWSRDNDYLCSLPKVEYRDELVRFILAVIDRYKPEAIEFWNEVETDGAVSATINWCCGCATPLEYNDTLKLVYSGIKEKYPDVLVIGGSLLFVDSSWTKEWLSLNPQVDAITFHYYKVYGQTIDTTELIAKRDYLQSKTKAEVWLGETALLCNSITQNCGDDFRLQQAEWMEKIINTDMKKIFWYSQTFVNWMECDLVNQITDVTYPAYDVFKQNFTHIP